MTGHSKDSPDPLKPRLFRAKPVERLNPAPTSTEPGLVHDLMGRRFWDTPENAASTLAGLWLPTGTMSRLTPPQQLWSVLVVAGDPGANNNRFDREIAHMRTSLNGIPMTERSSISASELAEGLRSVQPTVLHICAHADGEMLALHTDGGINWVSFAVLTQLLLSLPAPRLLVLNVCSCRRLADLLATWATATVYWAGPIDDDTARSFSSPFYAALSRGESVTSAVDIARADTPQLLGSAPLIHGNPDLILTPRAERRAPPQTARSDPGALRRSGAASGVKGAPDGCRRARSSSA